MNNADFIEFYCNNGVNSENRSINNMMAFSNQEMESIHNWVQWAFPTKTTCSFNNGLPVLSRKTWRILRKNYAAQFRFECVLGKTLKFLGFLQDKNGCVVRWNEADWFFNRNNHNRLRITRIIESCVLFGKRDVAISIFRQLLELSRNYPSNFTFDNLNHWYKAAYITEIK